MTGRWRERWVRLANAIFRRGQHAELDEELQAHVELATDEFVGQGLSLSEARRRAALKFGSRLSAREHADDQRSLPRLESVVTDVRYALRGLGRTPGLAVAAVLVLSVSIGVNVAVFRVANATLFKGFRGVADHDRLVYVTTRRDCCVSYQDLRDWRAGAASFEAMGAVADLRVAFDAGAGAETATATEITADTFGVLRVQPVLGRDFSPSDDTPGAAPVAIVSHEFWRTRLSADAAILGRTVRVNGTPTTVVGVMPPDFAFPQRQDLWLPLGPRGANQPRDARGLWFAIGRLADGVTIEQARSELDALGARLSDAYPATNAQIRPVVQTFREFFIGGNAVAVYGTLWGAVGLVLVIACANLVNLLLTRAAGRTREVAVQLALGAGRARIVRQQLFESMVLSLGGGVIGWWMADVLVRGYEAVSIPPTQPWATQLVDYSGDARVLGYVVAVSVTSGVVLGLLPAFRLASLDTHTALRDGGRGMAGRRERRRVAATAVVAQVALAVVLLSAAGVLIRSFLTSSGRELGFDPTRVLVALTMLPAARYPDVAAQSAFYERLVSGVRAIPGVDAVALVDGLPGQSRGARTFELEGRQSGEPLDRVQAPSSAIGPQYFAALGTSVEAGRDFGDGDGTPDRPVAIVNRRFAEVHWRTPDVIGRRLRVSSDATTGPWLTVVGVAPNLQHGDPTRADIEPAVYVPFRQSASRGAWLLAHTSLPPQSLGTALRREVQLVDSELPLWLGPYTLDEWISGTYWRRGVYSGLFVLFAVMAVLLACLGLFAVIAGTVAERRQEIGVRMAIGASSRDVLWLVLRQGLAPALAGLGLGLLASIATNRLLNTQLVEVTPWDPATLSLVAAIVIVTALVGCLVPAMRATRVDPLIAIRLD